MFPYPKAAVERAMKMQEVILGAISKQITWWQAAEIIGMSDRHMRRRREQYERAGFDGLLDRRHCKAPGWWPSGGSAVRIASGVRGGPCRVCCCTSTAASIAGFKTNAGTTRRGLRSGS
jgi:hypothetical protein